MLICKCLECDFYLFQGYIVLDVLVGVVMEHLFASFFVTFCRLMLNCMQHLCFTITLALGMSSWHTRFFFFFLMQFCLKCAVIITVSNLHVPSLFQPCSPVFVPSSDMTEVMISSTPMEDMRLSPSKDRLSFQV